MIDAFRTIALVAIGLHAVLGLGAEASENRPPSCPSGSSTFDSFQHMCAVIHKKDAYESQASKLSPEIRLDTIEMCSCALVNHELAWTSMMTHEAEALYMAIRRFIDETDQYLEDIESEPQEEGERARVAALKEQYDNQIQIKSDVKKTDLMLRGVEGERLYYWDRLTQIIRNDRDENNCDKVSAYVQRNFGLVLFDAEDMSYKLAKNVKPNSMLVAPALREKFSQTCWQLIRDFFPFTAYFSRLGDLANNPKLFFQLSNYSESLYKLRMTTLMCKFLEKKKKLTSQDEVLKKHRAERRPPARRNLKAKRYVESESESESESDDSDFSDDDSDDDFGSSRG